MEVKKMDTTSDVIRKPNYMLMSLQRILVLFVIMASVIVVVYYTPMPGTVLRMSISIKLVYLKSEVIIFVLFILPFIGL